MFNNVNENHLNVLRKNNNTVGFQWSRNIRKLYMCDFMEVTTIFKYYGNV